MHIAASLIVCGYFSVLFRDKRKGTDIFWDYPVSKKEDIMMLLYYSKMREEVSVKCNINLAAAALLILLYVEGEILFLVVRDFYPFIIFLFRL